LREPITSAIAKSVTEYIENLLELQEVEMMLMRTDPFRDLDRWTQQVLGTAARPAVMPMDAWRDGDQFIVEFDLPGVAEDSLNLDVERNVLTVHAERPALDQNRQMVSAERPRGVFSRQLFLGETLDAEQIQASYHNGVLQLRIPGAEKAKPRRIQVTSSDEKKEINA
jgi:HSP20 family protein